MLVSVGRVLTFSAFKGNTWFFLIDYLELFGESLLILGSCLAIICTTIGSAINEVSNIIIKGVNIQS